MSEKSTVESSPLINGHPVSIFSVILWKEESSTFKSTLYYAYRDSLDFPLYPLHVRINHPTAFARSHGRWPMPPA